MSTRDGNEYLEFPEGAHASFPHEAIEWKRIVLGEDTVNTCNIALADVDGDGLQEIVTPLTQGEDDCVRCYKGDGTLLWENSDIRLYHDYYQDPSIPANVSR